MSEGSASHLARRTEAALETALFRTRWLLLAFYFGLVVAMGLLVVKLLLMALHACLMVSGVLFAVMDRIAGRHSA